MTGSRRPPKWAIVVLIAFAGLAVFAPTLSPHDPEAPRLSARLEGPTLGGEESYLLGTDALGRDIFSRVLFGARVTLAVGLLAIASGALLGLVVGVIAGYLGGWVDGVFMRIVDGALAFPSVLIALLLAVAMGAGMRTVTIAIVLVTWSRFARVIRGEVLRVRESDYIMLARLRGCSARRVMWAHVLPNVLPVAVVVAAVELGFVITLEASLSFLGAGIPPPTPSWGQMVGEGRTFIASAWWIAVFPGVAIVIVVLAFNRLGDWVREVLDPRATSVS